MYVLLVVDMQKDFCYSKGSLYLGEQVEKTFEPLKKVIEEARGKMPIIFTLDWHRKDDAEFDVWPPHCLMDTEGAEIIDEIKPGEHDHLVKKRRHSAFYGTDLDLTLREMGVTELFITGVATNICVLHTAADASLLNYGVSVLKDCTATAGQYEFDYSLKHMEEVVGAKIMTSEDF
ncbi:MAG: isochorismatase family cysteine hydrolase [Archaeoglobaceae archaeon]